MKKRRQPPRPKFTEEEAKRAIRNWSEVSGGSHILVRKCRRQGPNSFKCELTETLVYDGLVDPDARSRVQATRKRDGKVYVKPLRRLSPLPPLTR